MANEKLIDTVGLKYYHDNIASVTFVGLSGTQTINGYKTFNLGANIVNNSNSQAPTFLVNWNQSSQDGFVTINDDNSQKSLVLDTAALTADRTITFPNASGTIALMGDLSGYLPLTGGTITKTGTHGITTQVSSGLGRYFKSYLDNDGLTIYYNNLGSGVEYANKYGLDGILLKDTYSLSFPTLTANATIATQEWVTSSAVPTMKTLDTTATTAQPTSSSETLTGSGTITLHKVSKTGTISDLIGYGTAASKNTGTSAGNVPVLDSNGKLSTSILPSIALTETYVVATQADMLALDAQVGDVCVVTGENKTYILATAGASTLSHWQEIVTPSSAGFVTSVNNQTGTVTLTASDVGAVATTASQGLTSTQQSNARANIGAMSDQGWTVATTAQINAAFGIS